MNCGGSPQSEVSQTQKDKYHMILLMWNLKKRGGTNELIYETEVDVENKLMVTRDGGDR